MSKPETRLRENIHKHLPKGAFRQGNGAGGFTSNGVPDVYYDGPRGDLWVEYKQVQSVPRSGIVIGAYTALQHKWLDRRHANGRNAVGIVGIPGGRVCVQSTPEARRGGTSVDSAISYKEAADYIAVRCGMHRGGHT